MKTQIQKIKEKAWLNGFDVTEAINHKGNRKLNISFPSVILSIYGDENGKFSCAMTDNGVTGLRTFTSVMKGLDPTKEYGIVTEVEGSLPVVGTGGTIYGYSDAYPVTVVEANSKRIIIRYDSAELDKTWKPETVIGGFAGVTTNNNTQRWDIRQNKNGRLETFTLRKNGKWVMEGQDQDGQALTLGKRVRFYDFNF